MNRYAPIAILCLITTTAFCSSAATVRSPRWNTFVLWSNDVATATLKYMPEASVADEDYMFVEFDNHTDKPLTVDQAWIDLPATVTDNRTHKEVFTSAVADGVVFIGELPPGKTKAEQHGVFKAGLTTFAYPPKQGYHLVVTPKLETRLKGNQTFTTARDGRTFQFDFRRPSPAEQRILIARFKKLLSNPGHNITSAYYCSALSKVPEVANSVSLDELLFALTNSDFDGIRTTVSELIGKRFPQEPRAISTFLNLFSRDNTYPFYALPEKIRHNPAFVEPLVKRYEKNGYEGRELEDIKNLWITNGQIVATLSQALLKHHPVLSTNVAQLSGRDLCAWGKAVNDAGIIGNTNFLKWLLPALNDKRVFPDCRDRFDSAPAPPFQARVCDTAVFAALRIIDGNPWPTFKAITGAETWRTKENYYSAHDRVIAAVRKRLKLN